jgi:ribonuclease-3 family protein
MLSMGNQVDPRELSPALWAYMGDALYELYTREYLVRVRQLKTTGLLHREAIKLVKAEAQAKIVHAITSDLSAEENEILRRGRNYKTGHTPTHTDPVTYRHSTAWEGLLGFLYLTGREERMKELIFRGLEILAGLTDQGG